MISKSRVLVVATSRKTRGGITSVVRAHETGEQWKKYHCRWIETHQDKGLLTKMYYLVRGLILYLFLLPSYDLVHIHTSEPVSAIRKLPFMALAKLWHKKTVVHFHSFSPESTVHSKYRWAYNYLFAKADIVITISDFWRKTVADEFRLLDKVIVVYNPCTASVINKSESYSFTDLSVTMSQKHSILYAGTVNARKGYADMIKAFAKIAKQHSDWMIVFAGNGEIEHGKQLAESLGIASQTLFLGWVVDDDKERAFRESTVFCLPSYAEGFPMAVLDAWSYGLPVITTPVGGIPDVAKDGENMLLFEPGDIDGLTRQMERMIIDKELRRNIAKESVKFAQTTFNSTTINKQIGKIYDDLLKSSKNIRR